jgi:hypothetical protein
VLTPEGVEALRLEAIRSGLFLADLHLQGGWPHNKDIYGIRITVLDDGGETVSLSWAAGYPDDRRPTPAEFDAVRGLVGRLADPGAWLPETAWEDRQLRAFVPSTYGINFSLVAKPDGDCCLRPDPSTLPPPGDELLGSRFNQCVTTDEARMLADGFDAAGIPPGRGYGFLGGLWYVIETPPGVTETQFMSLYPSLPHLVCR